MEKGRDKGTDTLQTDKVFTRKEYIEREKVIELLNKWADGYSYIEVPTKDTIARVRVIPAADVVARDCYDRLLAENDKLRKERPVVRCKVCKHAHMTYDGFCKYCDEMIEHGVDEAVYLPGDFFCADGERKDGDGDA